MTIARTLAADATSPPAGLGRLSTILAESERIGVEQKTIRRAVERGDLPAYRLGNTRVIRLRPADVDALFAPTDLSA